MILDLGFFLMCMGVGHACVSRQGGAYGAFKGKERALNLLGLVTDSSPCG